MNLEIEFEIMEKVMEREIKITENLINQKKELYLEEKREKEKKK